MEIKFICSTETVNHRKLAAATALSPGEVVAENLLLQATDNGSGE